MGNKKKILHLSQATGGVKTYVAHVLVESEPDFFEFTVLAPPDALFEDFCRDRLIPYYKVDLERGLNPISSVLTLIKIVRIIKKTKPDLIHAHSAKGGFLGRIAAKITGRPVIYTPHAFSFKPFTGLKRAVFYLLEYWVRNWTTFVLAISYSEAATAINEVGFSSAKVGVILNSIPVLNVARKDTSGEVVNIRMIGRLTAQKNPMLFLEIAERMSKRFDKLQFTILGAGIHDDLKDEIEAFVLEHHLGAKVSIEGWGAGQKSEDFLKSTDIYVSTSVFEGLPFSLLEAMSFGVPCVVSNVEGNADVIFNGLNGRSCMGVDKFCEEIQYLIENPAVREDLGLAAYNYVREQHNLKNSIKLIKELYLKLLLKTSA